MVNNRYVRVCMCFAEIQSIPLSHYSINIIIVNRTDDDCVVWTGARPTDRPAARAFLFGALLMIRVHRRRRRRPSGQVGHAHTLSPPPPTFRKYLFGVRSAADAEHNITCRSVTLSVMCYRVSHGELTIWPVNIMYVPSIVVEDYLRTITRLTVTTVTVNCIELARRH